ncbi:hypothetical protein SLEP1_g22238 [Rubroshorea leprosula]|uniref:Dof zinc finger protein n=1 Tax=Rubroshorea leprosula TaxID=152421 RepID=A0AAV5JHD9_9ROSI|nr:hypothetical protein SLEP1_g22238 [Rubroshorea leprosula]
MQQGGRGGGDGIDEEMRQNPPQDRRLKPLQQGENQNQPHQQHQPQKCPRCDSPNTKFCYYNNYSLTQPRFFCKTCRRYWTQGGTLRNVPVGGGCRKGKRTKSSSSGDNSRSIQQQPPQTLMNPTSNILSSNPVIAGSLALRAKEPGNLASPSGVFSMGSYYPGGGFLSSLAAIQSLHPPPGFNQPLNRPLTAGGDLGGSSNLGLFQGYRTSVPSFGLQQPPSQFYMGGREKVETSIMYQSDQETMPQSTRASQNWQQNFINNIANPNASDAALWSISAAPSTTRNNTGSSSLNRNQWPDLPGYGAPP